MTPLDPSIAIESWHAHVYFDAPHRDAAWALRELIVTALAGRMEMGALDVFVHPNTGDALADHRDRALWLGRSHPLNLAALDA